MPIVLKTPAEVARMRDAGRIVAEVLEVLRQSVRPGITTAHLDAIAEREACKRQAAPSFKGYEGFPAALCVSVNEEICHVVPGRRVLKPGDVVGLDFGARYGGWHADGAITVSVGPPTPEVQRLLDGTQAALAAGIEQARVGNRLSDISHAVERMARARGLGVVRELVGHTIGRSLHEGDSVPNFGPPGQGPRLKPGLTLCIEPMLTLGGDEMDRLDEWTFVTSDRSLSAHFEHTVAVTPDGPEILTRL